MTPSHRRLGSSVGIAVLLWHDPTCREVAGANDGISRLAVHVTFDRKAILTPTLANAGKVVTVNHRSVYSVAAVLIAIQ